MISPPHPNLDLDRPMTREEMMDALRYEGMFGISGPGDIATARSLEDDGLAHVEESSNLGITVVLCNERCCS